MAIVQNFTEEFRISATPATIRLTDTTDYAGAGCSHADTIIGMFSILDPSGAILYQNAQYGATTPVSGDLLPYAASDPSTVFDVNLPIDPATGLPESGNYTVNYQVYVHQASGSALNGTYNKQIVYNLIPQTPEVTFGIDVDCVAGKIAVTDTTNYGTYTSLTRVFQLYYPSALSLSPETTSLATISAQLYTKTWVAKITTTVHYGDVTVIVEGDVEIPVVCDKSVCDVACQYFALQDAYYENLSTNPSLAAQQYRQLVEISLLLEGIEMAQNCGLGNLISGYLDRIYTVGRFTPAGCGCSDESTPRLVSGGQGLPTGNTYSMSTSNGLTVFTNTVGQNTEFQVKINDGLYNVLNGLTKSTFTAGDNVTITPVTSADGSTVDYTIAANVGGATISISQVTDLQSDLDAKLSTTLANGDILVGNGSNVATAVAISGDVAMTNAGVTTVGKINGVALGSTTATSGHILVASGSAWVGVAVSGDATLASTGALTLKNTGTAGNYNNVNTDAQGRITSGSLISYLTANQTITLSGDVSGAGTTAITTTIGAGKITSGMYANTSIATAKIQNAAITTALIANNNITTALLAAGAVTTNELGSNAVTATKLSTDLQTNFFLVEVSFESEETGIMVITPPFTGSITVTGIQMMVSKNIAATDPASLTFSSSVTGPMGSAVSIPAGTLQGVAIAEFIPSLPALILSGQSFSTTTAKTTPGGKVLCTVYYTRA